MTVSTLSMVFMVLSIILNLGLVVGIFLFLRKRYELKLVPMFVGAAAFILFAMVLEQLLHSVVLRFFANGSTIIAQSNPVFFVLYGALAAGVFEETGRFISFKLLKKKYGGIGTSLSYGIGHGGIEVVLLVVLANVNNIITSVMINTGNAAALGNSPQASKLIEALTSTAPPMFLASVIERIPTLAVQVSLSVLVWYAVSRKSELWMYPLAIGLHAMYDIAPAMAQCGIIKNLAIILTILYIVAALIVTVVVSIHRRLSSIPDSITAKGITGDQAATGL